MTKEEQIEAAEERIAQELTKDKKCQTYLGQFKESSVEQFIKNYSHKKAQLEVYGDYTKFQQQRTMDEFQSDGWEALREIQHKKLFDTECLWRAEEVTNLSDIDITKDFDVVASNILDYDGIEAITENDIALYQKYLRKPQQFIRYGTFHSYYSEFRYMKEEYKKNAATFSEYFDYHNLMTGNHKLLFLPDIREEKELVYIHCRDQQENEKAKVKKKAPPAPTTPHKPYLMPHNEEQLIDFAKVCGDKKMMTFIKDHKVWVSERPDFIFDWAFQYLADVSPEKVSIRANQDWKEAIYFAAADHKSNRVADILPTIHQEYLIKKDAGITISEPIDDGEDVYEMISDRWRNRILEGRRIMGEPEDFNF